MSQNEDKVFMRHFTTIIVILVIFTVVIAFFGGYLGGKLSPSENTAQQTSLESRLQSPAAVYVGNEAPLNVAPVAAAPIAGTPTTETETVVASAEPEAAKIDGGAIYQTACFACHATGAAGAPKLEAAAWTERLTQGEDTLVEHAIGGFNLMPPKGGQMQLSDDEIRAIVQYMITQVQ